MKVFNKIKRWVLVKIALSKSGRVIRRYLAAECCHKTGTETGRAMAERLWNDATRLKEKEYAFIRKHQDLLGVNADQWKSVFEENLRSEGLI